MQPKLNPKTLLRRDDGAITELSLLMFVAMLTVGGLALDVTNLIMVRTHLQTAADAAAHAAIVARDFKSPEDAKAIGVQVARKSLPARKFGEAIRTSDIHFGTWDALNDRFKIDDTSRNAVLVTTQRLATRNNGVALFFLKVLGYENFDVVTQAVYETYRPGCMREGFVAEGRIDVQSNNTYTAGFCIHSNDHIELNNNNTFEDGVIVSMPNTANLVMPGGGKTSNTGLDSALRSGSYAIRILAKIEDIFAGYADETSPYYNADYLNESPSTIKLSPGKFDETDWSAGDIHVFDCGTLNTPGSISATGGRGKAGNPFGGGASRVKIPAKTTLKMGVIYTDCEITLGANVVLEDVLILSENTEIDAVEGAAGVTLGANDSCAEGGGVQIVTRGGVKFTSNLSIYGGQIIAALTIDFEANANGIEGVSMISGGDIDSTSNMQMGFCNGDGMGHLFEANYFRLSR